MSPSGFCLFALAVLLWQLVTGKELRTWWRPSIVREGDPGTYGFVLAIRSAILSLSDDWTIVAHR